MTANTSAYPFVSIEEVLVPQLRGRPLQQGWSPQCLKESSDSDDTWGVLKTTAIQFGDFLPEHNKRLPDHLDARPELEVRAGDLLLTCAGPRSRCGIPTLVRHTRPRLMLSGKMYRFRTDEALMDAQFLEFYLMSPRAQAEIDRMKTGVSDSGLNLTHARFLRLEVPLPTLDEQQRIVATLQDHFSRLQAASNSVSGAVLRMEALWLSSLRGCFEGRVAAGKEVNGLTLDDDVRLDHSLQDLVAHVSDQRKQVKRRDYLSEGKYPVIDQGADFIGGYTDDVSLLFEGSLPVIVFGDHTRIIKFVDQRFAVGADGVKLLCPTRDVLPRFAYYHLLATTSSLRSRGYARHFSELRKEKFWIPDSRTQARVVDRLDELAGSLDSTLRSASRGIRCGVDLRRALLQAAFAGQLTKESVLV